MYTNSSGVLHNDWNKTYCIFFSVYNCCMYYGKRLDFPWKLFKYCFNWEHGRLVLGFCSGFFFSVFSIRIKVWTQTSFAEWNLLGVLSSE